ncbi:ATP-binding protein [Metaclostridioides mangenotii]|uniref:nSTAND3 domain-containing NTPase n=1 Tax=Metaclostridioides mangenotii TaxID=1540 RepID=UPI0028E45E21|nr:ATP-binding protein [Clostridioides mangenotii]
MKGKIKRAFPGGNTSKGSYSFFNNIVPENVNRIFCLKGGPGVGKSSLMKKLAKEYNSKGYDIELFHCPSDPNSLDALVIKELGVLLLDGTSPHIVDPKLPGAEDEIVNLGDFLNTAELEKNKNKIIETDRDISDSFKRAYKYLAAAEPIYIGIQDKNSTCLNIGKLNKMTEKFIDELFKDIKNTGVYRKKVHLFGSAITPVGCVDHAGNIFPEDAEIYYLSGEIGTGKSTFIKRIADKAELKGMKVELYHYPLIPEKVESVYIENLNIGFTVSNLFSERRTIDFNEYLDKKKLLKYEEDIKTDEKALEDLLNLAISSLKRAKANHDIMEGYYVPNMDFDKVSELREEIIKKINSYKK